MIDVTYIRKILNLPDDITDEYLQLCIDMYKERIVHGLGGYEKITPEIYENPVFQHALLSGVACQLSKIYPEYIYPPERYDVGDISETMPESAFDNIGTWCGEYYIALSDLIKEQQNIQNVRTFKRKGLSSNEGWYS